MPSEALRSSGPCFVFPCEQGTAASIARVLSGLGMIPCAPGMVPPPLPQYLSVLLDGRIVGAVSSKLASRLVARMRDIRAATLAAAEGLTGVRWHRQFRLLPLNPRETLNPKPRWRVFYSKISR